MRVEHDPRGVRSRVRLSVGGGWDGGRGGGLGGVDGQECADGGRGFWRGGEVGGCGAAAGGRWTVGGRNEVGLRLGRVWFVQRSFDSCL